MHLRINIVACLQCNLTDCMRLVSPRPYNEEHKFTRTYERKKVSLHRLRYLPDFGQIKLIAGLPSEMLIRTIYAYGFMHILNRILHPYYLGMMCTAYTSYSYYQQRITEL